MPGNAVAATTELLTPDVIDKLAAAAGLDREAARRVVDAGVPAILSGLMQLLSKPTAVRRLACAVVKQPAGPWEGLAGAPEGAAQVVRAGGNLLASLLGGGSVAALTSSISKFTGASDASTHTLLSLLAPAIISALGRERRNAGVDAIGIADVLGSQKDLVAAAMPAGLSSLLQASGFYDRLGVAAAPASSRRTARDASAAISAYWALAALALAGLAWYVLGDKTDWKPVVNRTELAASAAQMADRAHDGMAYLAAVPGDSVSIGTYHGRDVYNRVGEKIGTVRDLVVGPDGRIVAAVIGVGRSLGIGEKDVAIPFSALQHALRQRDGHLIVDAESDQLRAAPRFEPWRDWMRSLSPTPKDPSANLLSESLLNLR
jgi:sporulation protein YlmC with PRC-barrel domain